MSAEFKARKEGRVVRTLEPRGLSRAEAAAYAGCGTLSMFHDWVRRNILPGPIPGTHRWDRKAIDVALDRASGLTLSSELSALEKWKHERANKIERSPSGKKETR